MKSLTSDRTFKSSTVLIPSGKTETVQANVADYENKEKETVRRENLCIFSVGSFQDTVRFLQGFAVFS